MRFCCGGCEDHCQRFGSNIYVHVPVLYNRLHSVRPVLQGKWPLITGRNCMKPILLTILGVVLISSCASSPENIKALPHRDEVYSNHSCEEIEIERLRIQDAVAEATGQQRAARKKDQALVLLFPAALLLKDGDDETAVQLAQLKGQFESIERVSTDKGCAVKE